jgi:hypothetical protein
VLLWEFNCSISKDENPMPFGQKYALKDEPFAVHTSEAGIPYSQATLENLQLAVH